MRLREIETRLVRLEQRTPSLTPGPHRCTDDELHGLIAAIRRIETGETLDPATDAWAVTVMRREGMLP